MFLWWGSQSAKKIMWHPKPKEKKMALIGEIPQPPKMLGAHPASAQRTICQNISRVGREGGNKSRNEIYVSIHNRSLRKSMKRATLINEYTTERNFSKLPQPTNKPETCTGTLPTGSYAVT